MSKQISIRKAHASDRDSLILVESKSTPNLRYVPHVFDRFVTDQRGEFSVAEVDGIVVGCAKFTVTPNNTAWVETLRVVPEYQGMGIGKRLYQRFFEVAELEKVDTLRMYTGIRNVVSRGLAEHFGFQLEETFYGAMLSLEHGNRMSKRLSAFQLVDDATNASGLLMEHADQWHNFVIMNRTFYKLTPAMCTYLAELGQVYQEPESGSVIVLGARFMPWQALHIGLFAGDADLCLKFAMEKAAELGVAQLSCMFPTLVAETKDILLRNQFELNANPFIVMKKSGGAVN